MSWASARISPGLQVLPITLLMLAAVPAAASTIVVQPDTKDTSLQGPYGGTTYVNSIYIAKAAIPQYSFNALLQFDLTALAGLTAADITSAHVELYQLSAAANINPWQNFQTALYPNSGAWAVGASWATAPAYVSTAPYQNNVTLTQPVNKWVSWDVTQATKDWVAGVRANNGLRLVTIDQGQYADLLVGFGSGSYSDPTLRPRLVVTAVPVPAAAWLFGSGLVVLLRRAPGGCRSGFNLWGGFNLWERLQPRHINRG